MNTRLKGAGSLAIDYALLIAFGFSFAYGMEYFFKEMMNLPLFFIMIILINTFTTKHMRDNWKDLILGDRSSNKTTYQTQKPGFTDEILETPTEKLGSNDDLNELLIAATKVKKKDHSDLMRNPLDD